MAVALPKHVIKNVVIFIKFFAVGIYLSVKINDLLSKISKEQKLCYLVGYFVIGLLKYEKHFHTNNYLDINIFSHCFLPFINPPTRIIEHSISLIDNILTNHLPSNSKSGTVHLQILSDHLPVFMLLPESEDCITNQNNLNLKINK